MVVVAEQRRRLHYQREQGKRLRPVVWLASVHMAAIGRRGQQETLNIPGFGTATQLTDHGTTSFHPNATFYLLAHVNNMDTMNSKTEADMLADIVALSSVRARGIRNRRRKETA